jgi:hypothetical protein
MARYCNVTGSCVKAEDLSGTTTVECAPGMAYVASIAAEQVSPRNSVGDEQLSTAISK